MLTGGLCVPHATVDLASSHKMKSQLLHLPRCERFERFGDRQMESPGSTWGQLRIQRFANRVVCEGVVPICLRAHQGTAYGRQECRLDGVQVESADRPDHVEVE